MASLFASDNSFDERLLIAYLTDKINLNPAKLNQILSFYQSLGQAVSDEFQELKHLQLKWLQKIDFQNLQSELEQLQLNLNQNEIDILIHSDDEYPSSLRVLDNYPLALFYQGNPKLLGNCLMLTVVGSRNVDKYAEIFCDQVLGEACRLGIGVVSGLALGVDCLAHKIAIQNNAPTIGVIGSGIDKKAFYPQQNWAIRSQILEKNGLVLSEYPPLKMPNIYTFPQRNRILAALTDLTWVVQANLKSGSLITALKARDLGKTLATTPADIRNNNFAGNLKLLKEGCQIITEPADITSLLGLKIHPEIQAEKTKQFGSPEEKKIYEILTIAPQNTEIISTLTGFSNTETSIYLSMLELNNMASNVGSNEWIRL
jgi:DNA processing protein